MEKFYSVVVKHKKTVIVFFGLCFIACLFLQNLVAVNYDMNDYLPDDTKSTVSLNKMEEEFEGGIPNARVMIRDVSIPEALEQKEEMEQIRGVTKVTWLDDAVDISIPVSMQDNDTVEDYYKDRAALYSVTIEEEHRIHAVSEIRKIIGNDNSMTGSAVSSALATVNTVKEIRKISIIAVIFVLFVLLLTTNSYVEPLVILVGLGVAIVINGGTNLIFGEISFVTNAAGSILQLAVSLDYSVFLIHRFEECRQEEENITKAMVNALCKSTSSILSSGLTTVIGFLALVLMRFKLGPDLGLALAKGIAISLITVFTFMPSFILTTYKWMDKTRHRSFMPKFVGFGKVVRKIAIPMGCLFLLLIVPSFLASNSNFYYYGSSNIYGEGTDYGRDKAAIEAIFGKSDTYVLMVPRGDTPTEEALSEALQDLPEVSGIISYVDTVGAQIPEEYLDADILTELRSDDYSRFVISVDADYEGEKTFALVKKIRKIAADYYPEGTYLAGEGVSTYDLMETVKADMLKVNLLAIGAVFLVLLLTMRSLSVPVILVLSIETAIWLNLSVPYFLDKPIYYIAYLIISSVQLGATVDYAILMTDRYKENRETLEKRDAVVQTISDVTTSIMTSGSALTVVGLLLGHFSTNKLLSQLGTFIGRGAIFSLTIVLLILPGMLMILDRLVVRRKKKGIIKEELVCKEK
ncbi:MAG: RND family transporter [Lachnospiraceae bacterium]